MIVIIDYGMGNIGSVLNMLVKLNSQAVISSDLETIKQANKLILPGVGAFDHGVNSLKQRGLFNLLGELVLEQKKPILGICLGFQLLARRSEEGVLDGFGWIEADTIRFKFTEPQNGRRLKVPHMGWTEVSYRDNSQLFNGWQGISRFYFVHSYYVKCDSPDIVAATATYGHEFTASVQQGHIFGVQFHPEKSHHYGMQLLKNFIRI